MRRRNVAVTLAHYFGPLAQLSRALRHTRRWLLARCFQEWREYGIVQTLFFYKVLCGKKDWC